MCRRNAGFALWHFGAGTLRSALAQSWDCADVRDGSIATKINDSGHFRSSLNSGSAEDIALGLVRAMNRHDLLFDHLVGAY
jgi:hypothetical protein